MEEVVEILGAQISCTTLGDVHVLRRGVRLGFERIKRTALSVLQRHIDPVEQLCRLVHGGTSLYSRHHFVLLRAASLGTAPSEPPDFQLLSVIPFPPARWAQSLSSPWGPLKDPGNRTAVRRDGTVEA